MTESGYRARLLIIIVLLGIVSILGVLVFSGSRDSSFFSFGERLDLLTVAFLDVGQGDAIFVETPDGVQMLIDGGKDSSVLRQLPKMMSFFDRKIDVVVATHPDSDHVSGLVDVLDRYKVQNVLRTENRNDTAPSTAFDKAVEVERGVVKYARAGQQLVLGASTTALIHSPSGDTTNWESNTASVVLQLRYGEVEFMLTGDAPSSIEDYLVKVKGEELESEVLKLGHHGSRTSTSPDFLEVVSPQFAVVSAGKDNRYGHPHQEVIELLLSQKVETLNTAEVGNIVFKSDGKTVWRE
jgi:competence protein ComEC